MSVRDPFAGMHESLAETVTSCLAGIPMFQGLDAEEIARVSSYMNFFDVGEGDVVFLEGEPGNYVCFVAAGTLAVTKSTTEGGLVDIAELSAGTALGEMAAIDEFPRSANVVARTATRLLTLTRADFDRLAAEQPELGIKVLFGIIRVLSGNLRKTSVKLADTMLPVM
ncbi:MAG: cyclic nucleotide-binding domain-containing protein [Thermodesulfobacteriota bacterium]